MLISYLNKLYAFEQWGHLKNFKKQILPIYTTVHRVVHKSTIPEYRPSKSAHESESSTPKSGQSSAESEVNSDTVQYNGVIVKSFKVHMFYI